MRIRFIENRWPFEMKENFRVICQTLIADEQQKRKGAWFCRNQKKKPKTKEGFTFYQSEKLSCRRGRPRPQRSKSETRSLISSDLKVHSRCGSGDPRAARKTKKCLHACTLPVAGLHQAKRVNQ